MNVFRQRGSVGAGAAPRPPRHPADGGARPAAGLSSPRGGAARPRARHRPDRLGQDHDARRDDRPHQRDRGAPHRHDRGPDRGAAPGQAVDHQPARDRHGHRPTSTTRSSACCARTPTSSSSARCATRRRCGPRSSAAETGHLVFSTLHTMGAAETINRIIDFFPPYQQQQVRMSLAGVAEGDRLAAARAAGRPRRAGCPRWRCSSPPAASSTRSPTPTQTHELEEIIADGEYYGMQTFDQSLLHLYADRGRHPARRAGDGVEPARPAPQDRPARAEPRHAGGDSQVAALAHSA